MQKLLASKNLLTLITSFSLLCLGIILLVLVENQGFLHSNQSTKSLVNLLKSEFEKCSEEKFRNKCYRDSSKMILTSFKLNSVLDSLEVIQKENKTISYHDFLHYLAREEVYKNQNLANVFKQCTSVYFNACYHGAVSGYIEYSGLIGKNIEAQGNAIGHTCDSLKSESIKGFYAQCVHGLGHGLMLLTNNELPQSLDLCDLLGTGSDREICYGGVFMENFPTSTTSDHPSKYVKAEDPIYPCNSLEEKYLNSCYTFLSANFTYITSSDWEKTAQMCSLIKENYRGHCYLTIGTGGGGNIEQTDKKLTICEYVPDGEPKEYCIRGVVISYSDRFGGINEKMYEMFDFCETVSGEYKRACYSQIGLNLREWTANTAEHQQVCQRVKKIEEKNWCIESV